MAANEAITSGKPIMPSTPQQTPHAAIGGNDGSKTLIGA
jgi:hypothetical protein